MQKVLLGYKVRILQKSYEAKALEVLFTFWRPSLLVCSAWVNKKKWFP